MCRLPAVAMALGCVMLAGACGLSVQGLSSAVADDGGTGSDGSVAPDAPELAGDSSGGSPLDATIDAGASDVTSADAKMQDVTADVTQDAPVVDSGHVDTGAGCVNSNDCPQYEACSGGTCSSACNGQSLCHGGCCKAGTCMAGTANDSCGSNGVCAVCGGQNPTCGAGGTCGASCGGSSDGTCGTGFCCNSGQCTAIGNSACAPSGGTCVDCSSAPSGNQCKSNGACGCNASGDCNNAANGTACNGGSCGCSSGSDCNNSPNGGQCNSGTCGCSYGCFCCPIGSVCLNGSQCQ